MSQTNHFLPMAVDGRLNVVCLTLHVLACGHTTNGLVQRRRAVAAANRYGAVEVLTEGFENMDAELLKVADNLQGRSVANLPGGSRG